MTEARKFIENWYGTPIPPDWDLEHEALANVTIIQLVDMLNQYTPHIAEQAVRDSTESKIDEGFEHGRGHFSACMDILSRIKTLTQTTKED